MIIILFLIQTLIPGMIECFIKPGKGPMEKTFKWFLARLLEKKYLSAIFAM